MTSAERVSLIIATVAVLASVFACSTIEDARDEIRAIMSYINGSREGRALFKEAEWTDAQGVIRRVRTEREKIGTEWESLEDWCKRHNEAVDAEMLEHPPAGKK